MDLIFEYRSQLIDGTLVTIQLALSSLVVSLALGLLGAWAKLSSSRLVTGLKPLRVDVRAKWPVFDRICCSCSRRKIDDENSHSKNFDQLALGRSNRCGGCCGGVDLLAVVAFRERDDQ